jgi:hypothetical protein
MRRQGRTIGGREEREARRTGKEPNLFKGSALPPSLRRTAELSSTGEPEKLDALPESPIRCKRNSSM